MLNNRFRDLGVLRKYGKKDVKMEGLSYDRITELRGADHASIVLEFPHDDKVINYEIQPSHYETPERDA